MMLEQTPPSPQTQVEALQWILLNRRPDVSFEMALHTLRQALPNDPHTQKSLDALALQGPEALVISSSI